MSIHPEKELFDEVRNLRSCLSDIKDRVFKLEDDYNNKVEEVEKLYQQNKRSEMKFNSLCSSQKEVIFLRNNNIDYPISSALLKENIFKCPKLLSLIEKGSKKILYDLPTEFIESFLMILRHGNYCFNHDKDQHKSHYNSNSHISANKKVSENSAFVSFLKENVSEETFQKMVISFNLDIDSIPVNWCLTSFKIDIPYSQDNILPHNAFSVKDISPINNILGEKAFFIGKNGSLTLNFNEVIRTNTIFIKPFSANQSVFNSSNGYSGTTAIFASIDRNNFIEVGIVSDKNKKDSMYKIVFNTNYTSFKYLKFVSRDTLFSLSEINLKKE